MSATPADTQDRDAVTAAVPRPAPGWPASAAADPAFRDAGFAAAVAAEAAPRIHPWVVAMHWTLALLLTLVVTAALVRWMLPPGDALRPVLRRAHVVLGLFVFAFALVRVAVRLKHPVHPLPGQHRAARWAATAVHLALYAVMLGQPLLGILSMQAGDKPVTVFGARLPSLVAADPGLHFALKDAHETTAWLFYGALALHVGAAVWHHTVRRDSTLRDMLGRNRPPIPRRTP
jgi:cytochrome b561